MWGEADACARPQPLSGGVESYRKYNARHDAVLEVMDQFVRENCPPDVEVITDLPAYDYTFLACIVPTDL